MLPEQLLERVLHRVIKSFCLRTPEPEVKYFDGKICLRVDGKDQGRCIGKNGIVFWALDTLMWYAGTGILRKKVRLDLLDPLVPIPKDHRMVTPFEANPNWDRQAIGQLIEALLASCFQTTSTAWSIEETKESAAMVHLRLPFELQGAYEDPNLIKAFSIIIRSAGMASGVSLEIEVHWQ